EAYARIRNGEVWMEGVHVAPNKEAVSFGAHDPDRPRKLRPHAEQNRKLKALVDTERVSLVPLSLHFRDGRVKVELGVGKGSTKADKRQVIAARDAERETARELARFRKGTGG